jgi:purine-binding chemotaxis protein CheW
MSGLVTFRLGQREYATPLDDVREVVRLEGLVDLPGMAAPLAGVLDLRGSALPVLDLRPVGPPGTRGDVLVLEHTARPGALALADGGPVGVAVDQVRAVVALDELPRAGAASDAELLPPYVVEVLRGPSGVVFLVDLARMVDAARSTSARTWRSDVALGRGAHT